jgi:hypothetical protein
LLSYLKFIIDRPKSSDSITDWVNEGISILDASDWKNKSMTLEEIRASIAVTAIQPKFRDDGGEKSGNKYASVHKWAMGLINHDNPPDRKWPPLNEFFEKLKAVDKSQKQRKAVAQMQDKVLGRESTKKKGHRQKALLKMQNQIDKLCKVSIRPVKSKNYDKPPPKDIHGKLLPEKPSDAKNAMYCQNCRQWNSKNLNGIEKHMHWKCKQITGKSLSAALQKYEDEKSAAWKAKSNPDKNESEKNMKKIETLKIKLSKFTAEDDDNEGDY